MVTQKKFYYERDIRADKAIKIPEQIIRELGIGPRQRMEIRLYDRFIIIQKPAKITSPGEILLDMYKLRNLHRYLQGEQIALMIDPTLKLRIRLQGIAKKDAEQEVSQTPKPQAKTGVKS